MRLQIRRVPVMLSVFLSARRRTHQDSLFRAFAVGITHSVRCLMACLPDDFKTDVQVRADPQIIAMLHLHPMAEMRGIFGDLKTVT